MKYIDFMSPIHKATKRDYLARVNDVDYPKYKASEIAKKYDFDYWDGDRRINYGGYKYMPGRWSPVADLMKLTYDLKPGQKVLDIGCGKGFQMFELTQSVPGIDVFGVDFSKYAFDNAKDEMKENITVSCASDLPFEDNYFDLVLCNHVLEHVYDDQMAMNEIFRVLKKGGIAILQVPIDYNKEKTLVSALELILDQVKTSLRTLRMKCHLRLN